MKIGFLVFKILRFYVFKMAANGGGHFEINIKTENYKLNLLLKSMHTHTQFTNVIFVYYVNNHFTIIVLLLGIIGKKSISSVNK